MTVNCTKFFSSLFENIIRLNIVYVWWSIYIRHFSNIPKKSTFTICIFHIIFKKKIKFNFSIQHSRFDLQSVGSWVLAFEYVMWECRWNSCCIHTSRLQVHKVERGREIYVSKSRKKMRLTITLYNIRFFLFTQKHSYIKAYENSRTDFIWLLRISKIWHFSVDFYVNLIFRSKKYYNSNRETLGGSSKANQLDQILLRIHSVWHIEKQFWVRGRKKIAVLQCYDKTRQINAIALWYRTINIFSLVLFRIKAHIDVENLNLWLIQHTMKTH